MKEISNINGHLIDHSKELTDHRREIEQLKEQLETQTKEVNQFTYIVSHDLQAPLRTITGFLDLLERRYGDKLDAPAKQFIEYAVKGAAKMKALVFDLLEYSRLNVSAVEREEVDLNSVLQEVIEKFQPLLSESGSMITTDELPTVVANKKQMSQLLNHLVDNSLKFRNTTGAEIRITLEQESGVWKIGIKDNGIGIDPAYFDKIFIVFRRLHTDEIKYPGTGIGLAVCKKIVELHGGSIRVESEINKGSTFYFTLPMTT